MTVEEQMTMVVKELINQNGVRCKVSLSEFYELLGSRFGTNHTSIIPSDYCYNRTNKGIDFLKKARLLVFLGDGLYECLGENYPFNGAVFTREKGAKEDVEVGCWENGIFQKNKNWTLFGLR